MNSIAELDHKHVWHPFTQMRDWLRTEPIVISAGRGAWLEDINGNRYLDANSSIWTNLHGHQHPRINAAIRRQLKRIAHSSALGFANEPASVLAEKLVAAAHMPPRLRESSGKKRAVKSNPNDQLSKVFFSDDGSTALEVALKLAYEFTRRTRGPKTKPKFLSLTGAYHGDTIGAVSLGHIDLFHKSFGGMLFATEQVMAPYCYRCPFNRARPERADARKYRSCHWECTGLVAKKFAAQKHRGNPFAAFVYEPLMQGAAGMIPQPSGWLQQVTDIARDHGALLIADEVMTGFGRTGLTCHIGDDYQAKRELAKREERLTEPKLFASARTGIQPDFLCLAKGLTGGYLPMAATLTTGRIFDAFLGEYEEFKTFFHGHSFTGNQLGAAAGLASMDLLLSPASIDARAGLQQALQKELRVLWSLPQVGDIRQVGLVVGVELVKNWQTRAPYALRERIGIRVCDAMARRGVLTRSIGSVIVLMPPYCTTPKEAARMVAVLGEAVAEVCGKATD